MPTNTPQYQRQRRRKLMDSGLCVDCQRPNKGKYSRCPVCRDKRKAPKPRCPRCSQTVAVCRCGYVQRCNVCRRPYMEWSDLRRHKERAHGVAPIVSESRSPWDIAERMTEW